MRVYKNSVIEWVVAESPEDAAAVALEYHRRETGIPTEELDLEFIPEPDDKVLNCVEGETEEWVAKRTCAEWAKFRGRGFLFTTEF